MTSPILTLINKKTRLLKAGIFFTIFILFFIICFFIADFFYQNTKNKLHDLRIVNLPKIEEALFLGNTLSVNNRIESLANYSDSYISRLEVSVVSNQGNFSTSKSYVLNAIPPIGLSYKTFEGEIIQTNTLSFTGLPQGYLVLTAKINSLNLFMYIISALFGCFLLYLIQNYLINSFTFLVKKQITNPIQDLVQYIKDKANDEIYIDSKNEIKALSQAINSYINFIDKMQVKLINTSRLAAIGQVSQMIAHDIRKPFSMLKIVLEMFDRFSSNPSLLKRSKNDISKAITDIEIMLSDIVRFSEDIKLEINPSHLISTFDFSIRQTAQSYQNFNVKFDYKFMHTKKPLMDDKRMARAFGNIISNAIEATTQMDKSNAGLITISSKDITIKDKDYLEIVIGNDGPPFQEEDIPNLFKSFFTKGKKRGIGLGLASASKIIGAHEGKIEAKNRFDEHNNANGVEFVVLVPSSNEKDEISFCILPADTQETQLTNIVQDNNNTNTTNNTKTNIKILLLDDETLYRAFIKNIIKKDEYLDKSTTVYDANNVDEALKLIETESITHAIIDIDLSSKKNGFDFLKEIKKNHPNIDCMIHSNRDMEKHKQVSKEVEVKMFVAKPLNIKDLHLFLFDEREL